MSKHNDSLQKVGTTVRRTVASILQVWETSSASQREEGAQWYGEARDVAAQMSAASGLSLEHCATVISHLSPRTSWSRNVAGAMALVTTGTAPACIGSNVDRARRAIASADPLGTIRGPKTRSFALNILGDPDAVTVDVWAVRIALPRHADPEAALTRTGVYDAVAHCYRLAARRVGVSPSTLQAATWIAIRSGQPELDFS